MSVRSLSPSTSHLVVLRPPPLPLLTVVSSSSFSRFLPSLSLSLYPTPVGESMNSSLSIYAKVQFLHSPFLHPVLHLRAVKLVEPSGKQDGGPYNSSIPRQISRRQMGMNPRAQLWRGGFHRAVVSSYHIHMVCLERQIICPRAAST